MSQYDDPGQEPPQRRQADRNRRAGARGDEVKVKGGIGMLLRHADEFGIDDEQRRKLESKRVEFELEKIDKDAAFRKAELKFRAAIMNDEPRETVLAALEELKQCYGDRKLMRYEHIAHGREALTDDQRQKLENYRRKRQLKQIMNVRPQPQGAAGGGGGGGGGGGRGAGGPGSGTGRGQG